MLKLGIIGISHGNGHPYSWSAICNGYDKGRMQVCEYQAIPNYLNQQSWPSAQLKDVQVSHIWTQDKNNSNKIALASKIPFVCATLDDFADKVDGILLARDDAEKHFEILKKIIPMGLPIFVDKPIALNEYMLSETENLQIWKGQIFSCSALRFSDELQFGKLSSNRAKIRIDACTPKYWKTYAMHLIDPILNYIGTDFKITKSKSVTSQNGQKVILDTNIGVKLNLTSSEGYWNTPIKFKISDEENEKKYEFSNSFEAFKCSLKFFRDRVSSGNYVDEFERYRAAVRIIEKGMK